VYEDSFNENVCHTLKKMGHEVYTTTPVAYSQSPSFFSVAKKEVLRIVRRGKASAEEFQLVRRLKELKPDLLLSCTYSLSPEILESVRKHHIRSAIWWADPLSNNRDMGLLSNSWDHVFIKDPMGIEKLGIVGVKAEFLPEAMNPDWHKPLVPRRSTSSIAVAGNYYGFRQALVARLIRAGVSVDLYGSRPPSWCLPEVAQRHLGKYLVREEKSRVFGEAFACLNSFSLAEHASSINCRAFEIAGAAGLQLIEGRPCIAEYFEPEKEVLVFRSFEELMEKIEWAKGSPREAEAIAHAGARRARAEHTYEHRLEKMLASIFGWNRSTKKAV
jgi:spore maturation protein CgeB